MIIQSVPEWRRPVSGQKWASSTPETGATPSLARKNGSGGHSHVGGFLALGRDRRRVFIKPRGIECFAHRKQDHKEEDHNIPGVYAAGDANPVLQQFGWKGIFQKAAVQADLPAPRARAPASPRLLRQANSGKRCASKRDGPFMSLVRSSARATRKGHSLTSDELGVGILQQQPVEELRLGDAAVVAVAGPDATASRVASESGAAAKRAVCCLL